MDVSVLIVSWNLPGILRDCLKSVYEQTKGISFEVIYVDNASEDRNVEMVREEFPDVRIIENEKNEGFTRGSNQAIEIARGRYVLLLNSDTVVLDNAIAKTVEFADAHPEAAVVGCKVLNRDKSLQRSCFMYPSILNTFLATTYLYKIFSRSKFFGRERMSWWDFDEAREVETVCGCFSLARREAIDQVGVMDEIYHFYGEDPDWCYRFTKAGWKVMFTPAGEIIHLGGQHTKQMARIYRWQLAASTLTFMRLHRSRWTFPLARLLYALFLLLRVPYWLGASVFQRSQRKIAFETAVTYLIGSFYCLVNWKRLLINREKVGSKL